MEHALTAANQSSVAYAVLPDVDPYAATEYLRDEQPYDHEHGDGDSDDGAYSPTKVTGPSKPPSATAGPAKPVITDDEPLRLDASFACVIFIGFVSQVEYAVIMPSMWQYVESLGGSHLYFGFAMASFSACRMVFLPLLGRLADSTNMRVVFVGSLLLGAAGSVLYALAGWSKQLSLILIGRLVCGAGAANMSVEMLYIVRVTTLRSRTRGIVLQNAVSLLGLVLGPAFNVGLSHLNYRWSFIELTELTSPGYFILLLELICIGWMLVSYVEPPRPPPARSASEAARTPAQSGVAAIQALPTSPYLPRLGSPPPSHMSAAARAAGRRRSHEGASEPLLVGLDAAGTSQPMTSLVQDLRVQQQDQRQDWRYSDSRPDAGFVEPVRVSVRPGTGTPRGPSDDGAPPSPSRVPHTSSPSHNRKGSSLSWTSSGAAPADLWAFIKSIDWIELVFRQGVFACWTISFVNNFMLATLETSLPPLLSQQYGWTPLQNSYLFAGVAVAALIGIIGSGILSATVRDVTLILGGQALQGIALVMCVVLCSGEHIPLAALVASSGVLILGLPAQGPPNVGVHTKIIDARGLTHSQGFFSGVFQMMEGLARIAGPLVASVGVAHRRIFYSALLGIWGVSLAILLAQYRTLRRYSHLHVDAAGAHADDDPAATIQGQDHAEDGTVKPPRLVDLPAPQMG